jgi:hypothetical protein
MNVAMEERVDIEGVVSVEFVTNLLYFFTCKYPIACKVRRISN